MAIAVNRRDEEQQMPMLLPFPAPEDAEAHAYTIHLPGFEGPLDLLLHLIERNQLEITTISLVAVTDQFITYIRQYSTPPLPRMAAFVAMAARLLLIKSRSLLPRQPRQEVVADDDPLDDAETLASHLLEYKQAREVARLLRARELAGLQSYARANRLADPEMMLAWSPPKLVGLNVRELGLVFRRVLNQKAFSEPEQLPLPLITVGEKIAEVEALLTERKRLTLEDVLLTATSRFAVVVTFLAVLEMWHQARVTIEQEELFGPVVILPGPLFAKRRGVTGAGASKDEALQSQDSATPSTGADAEIPPPAASEFDPEPVAAPTGKSQRKPRRKIAPQPLVSAPPLFAI
ncbi:MAG: segregation/condensation protein A [Ktedonobacterales bacterium]